MTYDTDEDASFDWDEERLAFQCDGSQMDLPFDDPLPTRFWIDTSVGLPRVKDRLYDDRIVGRFLTMVEAERYQRFREAGAGHWEALGKVAG